MTGTKDDSRAPNEDEKCAVPKEGFTQGVRGEDERTPTSDLEPTHVASGAPFEVFDPEDTDSFDQSKAEHDSHIGLTIGNYHILSVAGQGSFGTVYKARDMNLKRYAAIKFLLSPLDGEQRRRFLREAETIANLSGHPSIVQIYSQDEYEGTCYFALEYLDCSAADLLSRSPEGLPVQEALKIIADCCEALTCAHDAGVLHRDIKPGNILIDENRGRAKLCDFGLARFQGFGDESISQTIAGSPPYMSPEQAKGGELDERSDLYSLGVTLFKLLSGSLPYKGKTHTEVLSKILRGKGAKLSSFRPDLPEPVLELVKKATARRPEDRFQSGKDFGAAVVRIIEELSRSGVVSGPPRRTRVATAKLLGAGAIAALVAVMLILFDFVDPRNGPRAPVPLAEARQHLDRGNYVYAKERYQDYLEEQPGDPQALYGLGYALLFLGDLEGAGARFGRNSIEPLRVEGEAALAHAERGEAARPQLEEAAKFVPTRYPAVLIASLDVLGENFQQAIAILDGLDTSRFNFNWQRDQYSKVLGQAYFKIGDFANAQIVLANIAETSNAAGAQIAAVYSEMARHELDTEKQAAVSSQINRLKTLLEEEPADAENFDAWTSRPLRAWLQPADPGSSRQAAESGLADVFSWMLGQALLRDETGLIDIVDRDLIGNVLFEQELAQLSQQSDRVKIGQLRGARLLVSTEFRRLYEKESAWLRIIDTETTDLIPLEQNPLPSTVDPEAWVAEIADQLRARVSEAYPLRGRLTVGPTGPRINIGREVGVREGMNFAVLTGPDPGEALADATAEVLDRVTADSASVRLEGIEPETVSEDGLYVQILRAEEPAADNGE